MTRPIKHRADKAEEEKKVIHAIEYYKQRLGTQGEVSIRKAAKLFDLSSWYKLRGRLHGACSRSEEMATRQKLSQIEEGVLVDWCLQLYRWGWPAKVNQLRAMATDLLKAKGDTGELGVNWQGAFFKRWPQIKTKFVCAKGYKRFLAEDYDSFEHWFQLYKREKTANNVADCDVWNLDEKGVMLGVAGKARVIISKYEKNPHTTQSGNREWVTSTECVSLLGRKLGSWTI